jgi:hypothetical protein
LNRREIENLVAKLDRLRREQITLEGDDPDNTKEYCLYSPAALAAIEMAEEKTGWPFPPSFKLFLTLHNGWLACWPDWTLVGLSGKENKAAFGDIAATVKRLPVVANKADVEKLRQDEKRKKDVMLVTNHAALGTDFNGGLLLADRNRIGKDGEHQIAWVADGMVVQRRWPNFGAFLKEAISDTQDEIKDLRKKPSKSNDSDEEELDDSYDFEKVWKNLDRQLAAQREAAAKAKKGKAKK